MGEWDKQVKNIMNEAYNEARDMGNNYVGSEHILLSIMKDTTTTLHKVLANQGIYYFQLKEDLMVLFGLKDSEIEDIRLTTVVEDILERGKQECKRINKKEIDEKILTISLLETTNCVANEILNRYEANTSNMYIEESESNGIEALKHMKELRYLNNCDRNKDIIGRDNELTLMMSVLCRKEKANPLLVGDAGVGKTALVEKLASMIQSREVIEDLKDAKIYELHLNTLVAGTKYRGDFEEKLQKIINILEEHKNIIIFIDEIHQMIGAGKSEGSIDVASVLKPYLARGNIRLIGATTNDEYEKYIEKDRALERRFQVIKLEEPNNHLTLKMLKVKLKEFENFHKVNFDESLLQSIVQACDMYLPSKKFPDKAIDVIDLACVETKRNDMIQVNQEMILKVLEHLTHIPFTDKNRIETCCIKLEEKIIGHESIIQQISKQLQHMNQLYIQNKPLSTWLFVGKEGVGKSYFLQILSQEYFHQKEYITLDFSRIENNLEFYLTKLYRNPYTLLVCKHLEQATPSNISYLYEMLEYGQIEYRNKTYDVRHTILVICSEETVSNSISFSTKEKSYQTVDKEIMKHIDDTFYFNELKEEEKILVIRKLLKDEHSLIDEKCIVEVIHYYFFTICV